MNILDRIKESYYTRQAVNKTISFIKSNDANAFKTGSEISVIYYAIFTMLKADESFSFLHIYGHLHLHSDFKKTNISRYLNSYVNFEVFFSKLNLKILGLGNKHVWTYLRGYYINELDMFAYNISGDRNDYWMVLYDFHNHYLQFIFNTVDNIFNRNDVELTNNNDPDPYSISDISEELSYRLVFKHSTSNFKDSIKDILDMLYINTASSKQLYSKEDRDLYFQYLQYVGDSN